MIRMKTHQRLGLSLGWIFVVGLLPATTPTAHAQPYDLSWHTLDGGGGQSTGGSYTLSGAVGQHDAGPGAMMSGGSYAVIGGFWTATAGILPPDCDSDGTPDADETDTDLDGIPDDCDVCPNNRSGLAVDAEGRPTGDVNGDCRVNFQDSGRELEELKITLPLKEPAAQCGSTTAPTALASLASLAALFIARRRT
ncbi:MAG: thrombospondin type 3 repeat-containing protein [Planctomycetia bacterium]|jgi:hypothetical protein|nr:thrombospondin type 3 repeat-containing protein [Planctomycetia bacterium]MCC7315434.1 thrombospondin type 3 repeat-containing protein [Planctomycetota bacterium]